ncbi:MAG TPA: HAD family hydrolase [Leeuwenhoekiella sp.]|nr:HAD family hydrolase [Leeuwenhoekiella sp.]
MCLDIDGTLLDKNRDVSQATQELFKNLNGKYATILASSRMPSAMYYLQEKLGVKGDPIIAYNGALILGKQQKVLKSLPMPLDFLESILAHQQNHTYNVSTFCDDIWRTAKKDQWTTHEMHTTRTTPKLVPNDELISELKNQQQQPHKIMCMGEEDILDDLIVHLKKSGQAEKVHLYRSKKTYIEIITKNINKSDALVYLLDKEYDLPMSAVIAFGDNHNDVELLKNAGWGVAVANAKENVKAAADYVSEFTNKEDAVANELAKFLS